MTLHWAVGVRCGPSSGMPAVTSTGKAFVHLSEAAAVTLLKLVLLIPSGSFWQLNRASAFSIWPLVLRCSCRHAAWDTLGLDDSPTSDCSEHMAKKKCGDYQHSVTCYVNIKYSGKNFHINSAYGHLTKLLGHNCFYFHPSWQNKTIISSGLQFSAVQARWSCLWTQSLSSCHMSANE